MASLKIGYTLVYPMYVMEQKEEASEYKENMLVWDNPFEYRQCYHHPIPLLSETICETLANYAYTITF